MEQNHTDGRGRLTRSGSLQPMPRAGCRQTAQSTKRGCQPSLRSRAVETLVIAHPYHAATARLAPLAALMQERMAGRLNFRLSMADAW